MRTIYGKLESGFGHAAQTVYVHKYIALAAMVLITTMLAGQLPKLTIDTREESFFHPTDPTLIAYNEFRSRFGQDDLFFIALAPDQGLTNDFLVLLSQLHRELEGALPYLDEITSMVNGRVVTAEGDTLLVGDLMPRPPETKEEREQLLQRIDSYPLHENLLISPDRTLAIILVKAKAIIDSDVEDLLDGFEEDEPVGEAATTTAYLSNEQNVEIDAAIRKLIDRYSDSGIRFYFAGTPVFVAEIQRGIEKDLACMIPLSFLVIVFFLALLFRRMTGVVYPLIVVLLSLMASLGIMALWRIPITNAIQILPTFLIVVGIGDSVHILTIFYRNLGQNMDKRQAIVQAFAFAGLPVLMTSVTTACGLLSLIWADVAIIAQLGYIAPVGVMLAFMYTLVLLPALIAIFPVKTKVRDRSQRTDLADGCFAVIAHWTTQRPVLVSLISFFIVGLSLAGALGVRFSHDLAAQRFDRAGLHRSVGQKKRRHRHVGGHRGFQQTKRAP